MRWPIAAPNPAASWNGGVQENFCRRSVHVRTRSAASSSAWWEWSCCSASSVPVYESVAEAADARAYPAPGRMIDVGGHRLHINCIGTGTPTVVIDAGWGDSSVAWSSWVQPAAARTTRVCTYDRAGMGYSEPGPLPRTAERFAQELHTLLTRAGEPGPYVLVGHSLGGALVRVYAHDYPAEVAGVVLIDSMSASGARPSTSATSTETDSHSIVDWALTLPARTGVLRLLAGALGSNAGLSPEVQGRLHGFVGHPASLADVAGRRQGDAGEPGPGGCRQELRRDTADRAVAWSGSASG